MGPFEDPLRIQVSTDQVRGGSQKLEVFAAEDRIWEQYEANGDAQAFGAQWAAFTRASVFPTLAADLQSGGDGRSVQFFDSLEAAVATRLAAAPERMLIPLAMLLLVKESSY